MKYLASALGSLVVVLLITVWILANKVGSLKDSLATERSNVLQLQVSIDTQNNQIKKLQLDKKSFEKKYQDILQAKAEGSINTIQSIDATTCKSILEMIEISK